MNAPTSARDRFVAFAFCWADMLVELDPSRRVLFAVGATKAILGVGPEGIIGRNFMEMVSPKDRVLVDQLLFMTSKKGRIDNVTIRMEGEKGLSAPLAFAGYVMPDLKDHFSWPCARKPTSTKRATPRKASTATKARACCPEILSPRWRSRNLKTTMPS
jgi:PAS domain-containing protein